MLPCTYACKRGEEKWNNQIGTRVSVSTEWLCSMREEDNERSRECSMSLAAFLLRFLFFAFSVCRPYSSVPLVSMPLLLRSPAFPIRSHHVCIVFLRIRGGGVVGAGPNEGHERQQRSSANRQLLLTTVRGVVGVDHLAQAQRQGEGGSGGS